MSRRRKHGDAPGLKNTPRKAAATEENSSVVEQGKRRLRWAPGSGLRGADDGSPQRMLQQEQLPAAASCSKSIPEGETSAARPLWASALQSLSLACAGEISGVCVGVESEVCFFFWASPLLHPKK